MAAFKVQKARRLNWKQTFIKVIAAHTALSLFAIGCSRFTATSSGGPNAKLSSYTYGGVDVLTNRYDNYRSGANLKETILNTSNVNPQQFGKLFSRAVDGQIYAQPLIVSNFEVPGKGMHNIVIIATMHNSIYAFDADDASVETPYWQVNLGRSIPISDLPGYRDILIEIGTLSTPVIDRDTNTIYVVAQTKERNGSQVHRLHALDLATGAEKNGGPVIVGGSVPGNGGGSENGMIAYNGNRHLQRPGLLLLNHQIIFGTASRGDQQPYHGWVFAYDQYTLQQTGIFATCPNSDGCGFWMSGTGFSADEDGNFYGVTGNGFDSDATQLNELTESVTKFHLTDKGVELLDWFTPVDWANLDYADADFGVNGAMLVPGTKLLVTGSKVGIMYVMDRDHLGRLSETDSDNILNEFQAVKSNYSRHVHGTPIFWQGPQGMWSYVWGENDYARAFPVVNNNNINQQEVSISTIQATQHSMPGGIISISADGSKAGTGILWANLVYSGDANLSTEPGVLRALDASDLTHELWNSRQNPERDDFGNFAKFVPPTVANGKVYMATFSNQFFVYGLLDQPKPTYSTVSRAAMLGDKSPETKYNFYEWDYIYTSITKKQAPESSRKEILSCLAGLRDTNGSTFVPPLDNLSAITLGQWCMCVDQPAVGLRCDDSAGGWGPTPIPPTPTPTPTPIPNQVVSAQAILARAGADKQYTVDQWTWFYQNTPGIIVSPIGSKPLLVDPVGPNTMSQCLQSQIKAPKYQAPYDRLNTKMDLDVWCSCVSDESIGITCDGLSTGPQAAPQVVSVQKMLEISKATSLTFDGWSYYYYGNGGRSPIVTSSSAPIILDPTVGSVAACVQKIKNNQFDRTHSSFTVTEWCSCLTDPSINIQCQ